MDTYSSGEDLLIKIRKPYTITKQRERWTEDEHNRFLEALKLHGRAWQRIEEHIGTKTAVQIRSHAQKFFSKLEKDALVKGVPISQALDIDIPPPRPKRKPSNPYPRKTGACAPTSQAATKDGILFTSVSSSRPGNQILDLEKVPIPEQPGQAEEPAHSKENQDDNSSDGLTFFQEAPCTSVSSANKHSRPISVPLRKSCSFREFVPPNKEVINQDETNESYMTIEPKGNQRLDNSDAKETIMDNGASQASNLGNSYISQEKIAQGKEIENQRHVKLGALPTDEMQATQNYPRHVPVHILDGNSGTCTQTSFSDISYQESVFHQGMHGHPKMFGSLASSAPIEHEANVRRSSIHQSFPTFHPPFAPIGDNQESLVQFSPAFSSLMMSTLLQNPAAHAAASFAASYWPCSTMKASAESPACTLGGFPSSQMSPAPSMAAIAAATVAAATAWWAAHGLLPLCTPLHSGFPCTPASVSGTPSMDSGQAPASKTERRENTLQDPPLKDQLLEAEYSEALQARQAASKLPFSSSSDSEQSGGGKLDTASKADEQDKAVVVTEVDDSDKTKGKKQVDRSSCGSNTASSSEVETDALEKHEKPMEESNEPDTGHPASDSMNRRCRNTYNMNESWKEVSEEGRMAFRALFTRHHLPQSFSPPHDMKNKEDQKNAIEEDKQNADEKDEDPLSLDLNSKTWECCFSQGIEKTALLTADNREEGLLTIGLGYGKLKARRTGFKPYKRCSAEAKERRVANASFQDEEKCPKRIRLEEEPLT